MPLGHKPKCISRAARCTVKELLFGRPHNQKTSDTPKRNIIISSKAHKVVGREFKFAARSSIIHANEATYNA